MDGKIYLADNIMRILLEGTEEEIKNLRLLMEHGDNTLPVEMEDKYISHLWSVSDVQSLYNCTDQRALRILDSALKNPATIEQIWLAIQTEINEL
jgi:hypothetical protein